MRALPLVFAVLACIFSSALAASISSVVDLADNSATGADPAYYILNPGQNYSVDAALSIRSDLRNSIAFSGSGDTLDLINTTDTPLLVVNAFDLGGGAALNATGFGAGGYGLQVNGFTLTGSATILNATGGDGANAQGIRSDRDGFTHSDGAVTASGGSGTSSDGIYVAAGGYTMEDGVLNATGGSASTASGVRVAGGDFVMNDGSATVQGGTASNASGITVGAGNFIMNGGTMTADAGTTGGGNSHGVSARQATITGGTLALTGGDTSSSVGLTTSAGVLVSGGSVTVIGGTASSAAGIATNGQTMTVSGTGSLTATAGTANNAHGVFTNSFTVNGGTVDAYGGAAGTVHGISGNGYSQSAGTVTATASDTSDSRGVSFGGANQSGGSIIAVGGAHSSNSVSAGFFASSMTQTAGSITGSGGSGNSARGLSINSTFNQGGDVRATGGSGTASYGVGTFSTWTVNGGTVTAQGGGGQRASGAYAPTAVLNSGSITGTGGAGDSAHGFQTGGFTMNGGSVDGTGGSAAYANGFDANTIAMADGSINGTAGTTAQSNGVSTAQITQESGTVTALGDSTDGSYGIRTGYYYQNGGSLTATGGRSAQSYGLYVSTTFTVGGTVTLQRPDEAAASIFVNDSGLTFLAGSILRPVVNLANTDGDTGSGLIQTRAGASVEINSGARLDPWFIDRRSLTRDSVETDYVFIDTRGGTINGVFSNDQGGVAIQYVARKIESDSQYVITYERVIDTPDLLAMIPCVNSRRLVEMLERMNDPGDLLAEEILSSLELASDMGEVYRVAAHIGRTMTPLTYTKLTNTQLRTVELMQGSVLRELHGMTRRGTRAEAFSGSGWASAASGNAWQVWASGLYQQSNRFESQCSEFDSPKEKLYGLSTGLGRDFGAVAVAGGFSYVKGTYKSGYSDIDVDNYGVTLGVKTHNLLPSGGRFAPWAALVAGFAYGDIDLQLRNYPGTGWKTSSPSARMYRASAELGTDFHAGGGFFTLTPILGVDYAHIKQRGYSEKDPAGHGLRVYGNGYDSLRPRAGFALGFKALDRVDLGVNAHYRYETMDAKSTFTYSRLATPGVILPVEGEKRSRSSASVGATAAYRYGERCSIVGSYDLLREKGYRANRFSLGLGVDF